MRPIAGLGPARGGALVVVALVGLAQVAGAGGLTLEDANRRWKGARCRTREVIELTGEVDREGFVDSRWIAWLQPGVTNPNAPPAGLGRFRFANGAVLRRTIGDVLAAGSELTSLGWTEHGRGGAVSLELELAESGVRGGLYFYTPKPPPFRRKLELERLEDCERWARFDVFEILETPDERLIAVESAMGEASPSAMATEPAAPAGAPPPVQLFAPAVSLRAVAVQPAQVGAGAEVQLVLTYEIVGIPAGAGVEVAETRRLMDGEREVAIFSSQVVRGAGLFTSMLPVRVPSSLAPGMYTVRASIRLAGLEAAGTAFFEVRGDPR